MVICPTVRKQAIASHYDLTTLFYRLLWGPHIHHGLWEGDESPRRAQTQLTERLAELAAVARGDAVLDVGCGMGASAIHLANVFGCRVTGVTLSRFQQRWATLAARWQGAARQTVFRCTDAEQLECAAQTIDVVWSIECTEHLFQKADFFQRAAAWLKPGGRIAICAWLAGEDLSAGHRLQQVYDVCEGFFCPSLGTMRDYITWLESAGLSVCVSEDWTDRVVRTWEVCGDRVRRARMRWLARLISRETSVFLDRFPTILNSYQSGAMKYGCFVAAKP